MPEDITIAGYADDIAAVIKSRNTEEVQCILRQFMMWTKSWLESHGLQLAMHKTELLLLTRQHIPVNIFEINIGNLVIPTKNSIKYLGVRLDSKLTYSEQIEYATARAARITTQLSRLMANIGGPIPSRRMVLMMAGNSTLETRTRARKLLSAQRIATLRVISSYRTVSTQASIVIAGMTPIHLQTIERSMLFNARHSMTQPESVEAIKQEVFLRW